MNPLNILDRIRPSNLILLAAAPFILWLFATNPKYYRSLVAIIGVETNAEALFLGFLVLLAAAVAAFLASLAWLDSKSAESRLKRLSPALILLHVLLIAGVSFGVMDVSDFIDSVAANRVDPYQSELIEKAVRPRRLTPEAHDWIVTGFREALLAYLVAAAAMILVAVPAYKSEIMRKARVYSAVTLVTINGAAAFYLLFLAHAGFAAGLFLTIRATVFAYLAAAGMGLLWAGFLSLELQRHTIKMVAAIAGVLFACCVYFSAMPKETYALVGSLDARVAIIKGTPQSLTDKIRFGDYQGAVLDDVDIRSVTDVAAALETMAGRPNVTAAFVPVADVPPGESVLWTVTFLPSKFKSPAIISGVLVAFLTLLLIGAAKHRRHPLAIAAEFFIDTIRGIPMLVIILYIGLPLSGAIKSGTDGAVDFSNFTRGVIAVSIGYSAFMAEIFRAGINAVPKGQVEAAKSLGLKRLQIARFVILPQALRIVIPPLGNEFIAMLKDTSLLSILSVRDITQRMREFQAASFLPFAPFNSAAIFYVILTLAAASLLKSIERRNERKYR